MNNWALFGGTAAIGTLLVAAWSYVRAIWGHIASYIVVTMVLYDEAGGAAMAHFLSNFKRSKLGPRTYQAFRLFVRPRNRYERVASENLGSGMMCFWQGWKPLWVTRDMGSVPQQDPIIAKPVRVTFLRGLFDADQLVLDAVDFYNNSIQDEKSPRYQIYHATGIGRKAAGAMWAGGGGGDQSAPQATRGSPSTQHEDQSYLLSRRMLRWTYADIGPPQSAGSAMSAIALSQEAQELLVRLQNWRNSKDWFEQRGLPWKYGVLLKGAPGNGKTAFVRALAEDFNMPVFSYDLATFENSELQSRWTNMRDNVPAIALIEDIDSVFIGREPAHDKIDLTFDTLLNCIDGVERTNGLLLFITTNKPETLDSALSGQATANGMATRPGRIDCAVEFNPPDKAGRLQIANRILQDWPHMIAGTVDAGCDDTGAQFERRCIDLAQVLYWNQGEEDAGQTGSFCSDQRGAGVSERRTGQLTTS